VQSSVPPAAVAELGTFAPRSRHLCTLNSAPLYLQLGHFPFQSRPLLPSKSPSSHAKRGCCTIMGVQQRTWLGL